MNQRTKPHFVVVGKELRMTERRQAPQAVPVAPAPNGPEAKKVAEARTKFGQLFAHQKGTKWAPHPTRVLTQWMATRVKEPPNPEQK